MNSSGRNNGAADAFDESDEQDRIFDLFLEEAVHGATPPDLTAAIMAKLDGRNAPVQPASSFNTPQPPPVVTPREEIVRTPVSRRSRGQRYRKSFDNYVIAAALIAGVLLVGVSIFGASYLRKNTDWFAPVAKQDTPVAPPKDVGAVDGKTTTSPTNEIDRKPPVRRPRTPNLANNNSKQRRPGGFGSEIPFAPETQPFSVGFPQLFQPEVKPLPAPRNDVLATVNVSLQDIWQKNRVTPAGVISDEQWLERVSQTILGRLPTDAELAAFTNAADSKHADAVERMLASDEYARHWSNWLATALIDDAIVPAINSREVENESQLALRDYLFIALRENKPYDKIAFELLTAVGSNRPGANTGESTGQEYNAAVNFLAPQVDPNDDVDQIAATRRVARVFLGKRLECVQCHSHPANLWQQQDFWELNAFLKQMHVSPSQNGIAISNQDFTGTDNSDIDEAAVLYRDSENQVQAAFPHFANIATPRSGSVRAFDRREALATLVSGSEDLSRAMVNRVWREFFGYGFTTPIDDLGTHNPPHHPELFEQVAEQFRAHKYDFKELLRWIALSDAFRLSAEVTNENLADAPDYGDPPLFSRHYRRPAQGSTTELITVAAEALSHGGMLSPAMMARVAPRSPHDDPENVIDPTAGLQASLSPGALEGATRPLRYLIDSLATSSLSDDQQIDHLFLAFLGRSPLAEERTAALAMLKEAPQQRRLALQHLWWALHSSR